MRKLKVKNIIIGKQFETSENYEEFVKIINERHIKVYIVEKGDKIKIEKNLYFNILWPSSESIISENILNNNSLMCKLVYKNFSMLFTGDIEKIAEQRILERYSQNINVLKSTILKVAHHGSKTSSTIEFLEAVNPKIAVIGVGINNTFGHPSNITLQSLEQMKCKIYRTDKNGEISIIVKNNGKVEIKRKIK